MNIWFRRLLVILTIGGGFLGVVMSANAFFALKEAPLASYAVIGLFIGLYAYGIFVGIRLTEQPGRYVHVLCFYALQVPFFSSPILLYRFGCGFHATIGFVSFSFGWAFRVGSDWQLAILRSNPWGLGVNLFALIILFAVCVHTLYDGEDVSDQIPSVANLPSAGY